MNSGYNDLIGKKILEIETVAPIQEIIYGTSAYIFY